MRLNKSFGTHNTEKPPGQLVRIVFWSGIGSNGPKMMIFGQKCHYWAKFGPFWGGRNKTFNILISGSQRDTFFVLKTLIGAAPIGRQGQKCAFPNRKFGYLGPKVNFLYGNCDFFQQGISPIYPGLQLPYWDLLKKFSIFRQGSIFGARAHF